MIVKEYLIEELWFAMPQPGNLRINSRYREIDAAQTHRTIIQVVRPPYSLQHESSIKLRETWDAGEHFPSIWRAQPGIYKEPHTIISASKAVIAVKAKHQRPHAASCQYVALVEQDDDTLATLLSNQVFTPNSRVLGIFKRLV